MRHVVAALCLVAAAPACTCGSSHSSAADAAADGNVRPPDASTEAGPSRDAGPDAAPDAGSGGRCPPDEAEVEWFPIERDPTPAACGEACRRITSTRDSLLTFDVSETYVVYTGYEPYVGVANLETGDEIGIRLRSPDVEDLGIHGPVAVTGSTLVYGSYDEARRGFLWRVDLSTRCRRLLRQLEAMDDTYVDAPRYVDADGSRIVWTDERSGAGRADVFSYDLTAGKETRLTSDACCVGESRIWQDRAVYQGWAGQPRGIQVVDAAGGTASRAWGDRREQAQPAIHGNRVVFRYAAESSPEDLDVHGIDLANGTDFVVVEHDGAQTHPDVFGDLVVWEDERNGEDTADIYARDLAADREIQVTSLEGTETRPRVWGRTVFFRKRPAAGRPLQIYAVDVP